ncbi:von Willebrand factor type A domain-containing protein [Burkholderiales bacterium 8X]|nr:von Willebrand factor type A domain-containing protein [Burkholderiales bacterium 8X]
MMNPLPALRRPALLLLCAQMALSGCGATELAASPARWPTPAPMPEPIDQRGPQWPSSFKAQTTPNFEAPSATHCARGIQTVEVPGDTFPSRPRNKRERLDRELRSEPGREDKADTSRRAASPAESLAAAGEATSAEALPATPPAAPAARAADRSSPTLGDAARFAPPAPGGSTPQLPQPLQRPQITQVVTAGMVDDNADFGAYMRFTAQTQVAFRARDVSERHLLQVRDRSGSAVPDAEVAVHAANGAAMWARTDAAGRAWLHPNAFDPGSSQVYEVAVRKDGVYSTAYLRRGQKSAVDVVLAPTATIGRARLDLVFLIDATGSMGDEIGKLRRTLKTIADEVARLPSRPDTCFGLMAYRDRGDAFLTRRHDFTNDLNAFQSVLNALQADGGGDYPEALSEALHETVHKMSWRGSGATRMVVLLADAPPHLDYGGPRYDEDMMAALGKGIKVFSVGASGLDKQGEVIQRQIAQYTGGSFVFLTYKEAANPASGPGRETVHDVGNYSVQTLDRLIVRLVTEELAKLPRPADRPA